MKLNPLQNDRAADVLVALAAGDALGAGYEFGAPLPDGAVVTMKDGGPFGFAPAEWTDVTSMAIPIAEALLESAADGGSSSPRGAHHGGSGMDCLGGRGEGRGCADNRRHRCCAAAGCRFRPRG